MKGRVYRTLWAALACLSAFAPMAVRAQSLDAFYRNDGAVGIARATHRIEKGLRVLHVGAHPDDEDSALVAYLSLIIGARVVYFSLTRGEGGQNLIGEEMGEDLGVLRTEELLAARGIDGATQLFGRAWSARRPLTGPASRRPGRRQGSRASTPTHRSCLAWRQ